VAVHRGQADLTAVKSCLRILKDKQKPLLIFPTGTRTSTPDEVENLKNGVAMFALKSQCQIVPMVLVRKPIIFRRNRLVVGEPIDITPFLDRKGDKNVYAEINAILSARMEDMLNKYSYKKKAKRAKVVQD
jgi:1-acyl-sn-glycerol-3-phosphate acyltransferase